MGYRRILIRRDTAANWTANNPTLAAGEFGHETDTGKLKLGTGAIAWNSLGYQNNVTSVNGQTGAVSGLAPTADPTITGTVVLPSTTSIGNVTSTEIGYVDGVTSAIQTQIDTKAPLASPTFTGTVTIPAGASISGFAPLASPTFTGTVVLPNSTVTAAMIASDAVTQAKIADRAVGSTELTNLSLNAQTGTTYTLALSDAQKLVTLTNASAISLTVPTNSSVAFTIGDQVNLLQLGAGQVTVSGAGVTLRSEGSKLKLKAQYAIATLIKVGTDEWVVVGNLAA
jgi:hypothetical protein